MSQSNTVDDVQKNIDLQNEQLENIRQEQMQHPNIGVLVTGFHELREEYISSEANTWFVRGIDDLASKYGSYRRVRGDGNCFFRAFLFTYLECLQKLKMDSTTAAQADVELARMIEIVNKSRGDLVAVGYEEGVFEMFWDTFSELLEGLFSMDSDDLHLGFQEGGQADYYIWYMRLITAGNMKRQVERFEPFCDNGCDLHGFVQREVEPMGRECDQPQMMALTEYLGVSLRVVYLDGRAFRDKLNVIELGGSDAPFKVHLLYRPGHYDIIYPE